MRARIIALLAVCLAVALAGCAGGGTSGGGGGKETTSSADGTSTADVPEGWGSQSEWVKPTMPAAADFVKSIDNPYWPASPGAKWKYKATTDEGTEEIEVEVQDDTKEILGVTCTVVRDTVKLDGELIEDTLDWYAQDKDGNVWYMGEQVDNYENGKLKDHAGSWEAGKDGAQAGIKVWTQRHVDQPPYYQEYFKGEAEDLAKDLRTDATATVPAGDYSELLLVEEWTPLDPGIVERKYYAKGVGTVKEEMVIGGEEVVELQSYEKP